jgi:hypothetical protein
MVATATAAMPIKIFFFIVLKYFFEKFDYFAPKPEKSPPCFYAPRRLRNFP